ncbi:MAG: ZIP family metal transporter [Proteobacteria bacterium]|nr:ZIP family metal transporter [Pseudomonadota bacterium]
MPLLGLILLCAAFGGIASAAFAVVFLWLPQRQAARILPHFVSFATGALLGAALLGLLPEAIEGLGVGGAHRIGVTLVLGLGFFFVIEKIVLAWHAHAHEEPGGNHVHEGHGHVHASGILVLVGDSIHNALDGVLIASAFLSGESLGLVTTLAVAAHEIPHRVGDFAILVQSGFSRARALTLNLATGTAALVGALLAWFWLRQALTLLPYALAVAAAGFLYIAVAGLIPGLHRSVNPRASVIQVMLVGLGIAVIAIVERWV